MSEKANPVTDRPRTPMTMRTRLLRITPVARLLCLHLSSSIGRSTAGRTTAIGETLSIGNNGGRVPSNSSESYLVCPGHQTTRDRMKHLISCERGFSALMIKLTIFNSHHVLTLSHDGKLHLAPLKDNVEVCSFPRPIKPAV